MIPALDRVGRVPEDDRDSGGVTGIVARPARGVTARGGALAPKPRHDRRALLVAHPRLPLAPRTPARASLAAFDLGEQVAAGRSLQRQRRPIRPARVALRRQTRAPAGAAERHRWRDRRSPREVRRRRIAEVGWSALAPVSRIAHLIPHAASAQSAATRSATEARQDRCTTQPRQGLYIISG